MLVTFEEFKVTGLMSLSQNISSVQICAASDSLIDISSSDLSLCDTGRLIRA